MRLQITIFLSLLALSMGASNGFTAASFNQAPVTVFDSSSTKFEKYNVLGNYLNDTNVVVYGFTLTASNTWQVTRKYLKTADWTVDSSSETTVDTTYTTQADAPPIGTTTLNGYLGFAFTLQTSSIEQIYVATALSNFTAASDFSKVAITSNSASGTTHTIQQVWGQDSYIYVLYVTVSSNQETALYLQGVLASKTSTTKFSSPLLITSGLTNAAGATGAKCGSDPSTNTLLCAWKDAVSNPNKIQVATVNLTSLSVGSASTLISDDGTTTYSVLTAVSSGSYCALILNGAISATNTDNVITAFINSTTTSKTLSNTIPTDYKEATAVIGGRYYDGFFLIYTYPSTTASNDHQMQLQKYNVDGTVNGSALVLGTVNNDVQGITLSDSSYVALFQDTASSKISGGYLGKIFAETKNTTLAKYANAFQGFLTLAAFILVSVLAL